MKWRAGGPERDPETGARVTEVLRALPSLLFPAFVFLVPETEKPMGKTEHMQIPALGNDPGALTEDGLLPALPGTLQAPPPHPPHPGLSPAGA